MQAEGGGMARQGDRQQGRCIENGIDEPAQKQVVVLTLSGHIDAIDQDGFRGTRLSRPRGSQISLLNTEDSLKRCD